MNKTCTKCFKSKDTKYFDKRKDSKVGLRSWCRKCQSIKHKKYRELNKYKIDKVKKQWRDKNPHNARRRNDFRNYGLSETQSNIVNDLRINGNCFCCGVSSKIGGTATNGGVKKLCIDHDHESGFVRGILCGNCNKFEGQLTKQLKNGKIKIEGWWKDYLNKPPGIKWK